MSAQRTGDVVKARLPQYGIVEEALDKNHLGEMPDLLPCIQAALGTGQEPMSEGGADAAAIEVHDGFALTQREDNALVESIGALRVEQARLSQQIKRITLCRKVTSQTSAGGVPDLEFSDQGAILQSAPVEITKCLRVVIELLPIENSSLLKQRDSAGFWSALWIKACEALAERQSAGQLDEANQVAALPAAMTVENI